MTNKAKNAPFFNGDKELADYLLKNASDSLKQAIKVTVSFMVKEEMEGIRREMNEKLSFNGYYQRNLISAAGKINDIDIPRFREMPHSTLNLKSTGAFESEKENFLNIIAEMHRTGESQRKIERLAKNCFGIAISKNRIGQVHRELAEEEEFKINNESITDEFEYLLVDGIWVRCKNFGLKDGNKAVLLCSLGINKEGKRKLIGFQFSFAEDYESWHKFLLNLKERGLKSGGLDCIISDDCGALAQALFQLFPKIKHQVCIVHKLRNVIGKTSHKHKAALSKDVKMIYRAESKEEAQKRAEEFAKRWYVKEEKAVGSLRYNFEKTLTYFDFAKDIWKKIRTTNILEREFGEVRRRIKVFDNSFNDPTSCKNYAGSIFSYLNNFYPERLHTKC